MITPSRKVPRTYFKIERRQIAYKGRVIRLSNEQWERIRSHFPEEDIAEGRPGRKPIPTRAVLDAVLWLLNTGAQWHMLPQCWVWPKSYRLVVGVRPEEGLNPACEVVGHDEVGEVASQAVMYRSIRVHPFDLVIRPRMIRLDAHA